MAWARLVHGNFRKWGPLLVWHICNYHLLQPQQGKETPKMCLLKATCCDYVTPQGPLPGCVSVFLRDELQGPLSHFKGTLKSFCLPSQSHTCHHADKEMGGQGTHYREKLSREITKGVENEHLGRVPHEPPPFPCLSGQCAGLWGSWETRDLGKSKNIAFP